MQTKSYTDLNNLIKALSGVNSFTTEEDSYILSFVNSRAQQAYDTADSWARYLVSGEERNVAVLEISEVEGTSSSDINGLYRIAGVGTDETVGTEHVKGSNIYIKTTAQYFEGSINGTILYQNKDNSKKWSLKVDSEITIQNDGTVSITTAGTPHVTQTDSGVIENPVNVKKWSLSSGSTNIALFEEKQLVPYDMDLKSSIGEFIGIFRKKPSVQNSVLQYDFFVDENGANLLSVVSPNSSNVFVTYKKELETITTSSSIPREFFNYLAHAVYADFLRMDGQTQKAFAEDQIAQNYLDLELDKLQYSNNTNYGLSKFSTYVSKQAR